MASLPPAALKGFDKLLTTALAYFYIGITLLAVLPLPQPPPTITSHPHTQRTVTHYLNVCDPSEYITPHPMSHYWTPTRNRTAIFERDCVCVFVCSGLYNPVRWLSTRRYQAKQEKTKQKRVCKLAKRWHSPYFKYHIIVFADIIVTKNCTHAPLW